MNLKVRLIIMNFLEFAVWGAYLTCMGNYLGAAGLPVSWFYVIQGLVSIFMPTLMGIIADKYIQPQRLLGICHLLAGAFMLSCWYMGYSAGIGADGMNPIANQGLFITLYTLSVAFYMPTLALSNTAAFSMLNERGYDTVKAFPPIRVFGTIGFIATMWFVNCAVLHPDKGFFFTLSRSAYQFQMTYMQFFVSGALSLVLFLYTFTLPQCKITKKQEKQSLSEMLGLNAFKLFKDKKMAMFFIFSALLGMCLQVTNGYATPFLKSFEAVKEYANSFAANNATMLISLSQVAEALCILLIPFFLKRFGIKKVMLMAMFAWVFRFGFFGIGNPNFPGVLFFVLSCIVYGVAFDFFNVSGGLFVDKECKDPKIKGSAQGLFMLMTNGIGASVGTYLAGKLIEGNYCNWTGVPMKVVVDGVTKTETTSYLLGNWQTPWFIFSAFALVVAVCFWIMFKYKHDPAAMGKDAIKH